MEATALFYPIIATHHVLAKRVDDLLLGPLCFDTEVSQHSQHLSRGGVCLAERFRAAARRCENFLSDPFRRGRRPDPAVHLIALKSVTTPPGPSRGSRRVPFRKNRMTNAKLASLRSSYSASTLLSMTNVDATDRGSSAEGVSEYAKESM